MFNTHRLTVLGFSLLAIFVSLPMSVRAQNNPAPLINSLSPTAAAPGGAAFTLTVVGANFVSGSVVNWNGSPRTTTFVNVTQVTAAITAADIATAGTALVTVNNPAPGGNTSNQEFFSISSPASRINFSSNSVTNQVVVTSNIVEADFNNDGKLDLAVAVDNIVFVLLGNGDGTFQSAISSAVPGTNTIQGLYVTDVNHDGKPDLYATGYNNTANLIDTLIGKGDGTFNAPVETTFPGGSINFQDFVFADFNKDGILDVAFAENRTQVDVLFGNSDGSFSPGAVTTINGQYVVERTLAAADFTGQGSLSLVVQLNNTTAMLEHLVGILTGSNGSFNSTPIALTSVGNTYTQGINVIVADFNGDGFPDLATLVSGVQLGALSSLEISLNTGNTTTPTFGSPYTVPGSTSISQGSLHPLVAGDFNGDGILDLASDGLIFFGKGDGTFPTSYGNVTFSTGGNNDPLDFLLAGDFNNDGKTDLIRVDPISGINPAFGILLQIPPPPDFSGSISPSTVLAALNNSSSTTVTLQALFGFSSNVTLSISGVPAGITATFTPATITGGAGSSTLSFAVGSSVALGTYNVTVTGTGGGVTHSSTFPLIVNSSPGDFTGSVSPDPQNIAPGQAATYSITISPTGGFNGNVTLSLSGSIPPGSTFSFNPATITGGSGSSTLTINTPSGLSANVYDMILTATSGNISKSHTLALGINPSGGDFTGTYTASQTSSPTGLVQYNFFLQPINGYNQPVTISLTSGMPPGTTNDGPTTVPTLPGARGIHVTLTNVAPGTYPILVTLAGPGVVHEVTVQLVVQ